MRKTYIFLAIGLIVLLYGLSTVWTGVDSVDPSDASKATIKTTGGTDGNRGLVLESAEKASENAASNVESSRPTKGVEKALEKVKTEKGATKPMTSTTDKEPIVEIKTNLGSMKVKLFPEKAPGTVKNFLHYVDKKFYNDTVFHRVISNFMIQGGGFSKTSEGIVQKPTENPIKIESNNGLKNKRGSIAMARTGDPDSATSQFFINVGDNSFLDYPGQDGHGYTVFGETVGDESLVVIDKIEGVKTAVKPLGVKIPGGKTMQNPSSDVPVEDVVIESITLQK